MNKETPTKVKISILMAAYNTPTTYITRAIDSVLKQDFQDYELVIVDDGGNAQSRDIILSYATMYQDKIIYIRHSNRGQSESINRAVKNSSGEYITILDSDDEYKSNHLSACLEAIDKYDLVASTTETVVDSVDDYFVPDKNDQTKLVHLEDCILFGTLFGKREVFQSISFKAGFAADADFFEKASIKFRTKKLALRTYIYYRNLPFSTCSTIKRHNLSLVPNDN